MEQIKVGDLLVSKLNPDADPVKFVMDFGESIGIQFVSGSSKGMRAVFSKEIWKKHLP